MSAICTTRGVPFEPSQAAKARAEAARVASEEQRRTKRRDRREHGRMLDQIELSYRQHRTAQSR
jgi:hypothetical protein